MILLQQPIAERIEVIERTDDYGVFFARDVDGLGSIGGSQYNRFPRELFLPFDVGDGAVSQVKSRNDFTVALGCSNVAFCLPFFSLMDILLIFFYCFVECFVV